MSLTCPRCGTSRSPWDPKCPSCGDTTALSPDEAAEGGARAEVRARLAAAARAEYEVVGELGRGGMGWVFLCRDVKLGRLAALKVLPPMGALKPASVERFRREAETAARLSHPNIVPIYGAGGDMDTPYFAMAYIEGETLAERIQRAGALPFDEALRIVREVGTALAYAHRQGIVHRDIKPQNVLLERETSRAVVADFGIARAAAAERMTMSGFAVGTPGYMAPEQAAGAADVDARADQYALGVLLFEMLSGAPFDPGDSTEWPISSASVKRAAHRAKPGLPVATVDALARAMAPRREDRWPSVDAFLAALEAETGPRGVVPRVSSRSWWYGGAAAALVLAAAALVLLRGRLGVPPQPEAVAAGAPKIAIMRFEGDTAETNLLLGMVEYRLRNLMVRVAERLVFAPLAGSDPTSEVVRDAARKAGASWILHGSVEPSSAGRELLVSVVSVASGLPTDLGRTTAPAMSGAAADSVVLRLARGRVGRDLGLAAGAALAPISLDAVHAWRAAEEAFQRADYETATRQYDHVAALDPGFALAPYKRFLAALQAEPTEDTLRAAVAAMRRVVTGVGLPEREGRLLRAYLVLFDGGDVAGAEAQLRQLVAEDSTFLDGWFALGEVRYHFGALAGLPADSAASAFRHALRLWPEAAPALMHLIALHVWLGRLDDAEDATRRYLAQDSMSLVGQTARVGRTFLFGSFSDKIALRRRLPGYPERVLEFAGISGAQVARDRFDRTSARLALAALADGRGTSRARLEAARFLPASYLMEGLWRSADHEVAARRAVWPQDPDLARWPGIAFLLGLGAPDAATRPAAARASDPSERAVDLWLAGVVAVERGDLSGARRYIGEFAPLATPAAPPAVTGMRETLEGRLAEEEGDTASAMAAYERGLRHLYTTRTPFSLLHSAWFPRYRLALLKLAVADTTAALALFDAQDFVASYADQLLRGPVWLRRGLILAARGDTGGARRYLGRAADLLEYAEPPWDAVRDSARSALERIGSSAS